MLLFHPDAFMVITDSFPIVFFSVLNTTTLMNSLNFYELSGMCNEKTAGVTAALFPVSCG